jgi:hypothetical protein
LARPRVGALGLAWGALPLLVVALVAWLPLCDAWHRCGCEPAWLGAMTHCNVHASAGPRCPWCVHPLLSHVSFAVSLGAAWAVQCWRARRGASRQRALIWALAAWALAAFVSAAVAFLLSDYPHFLVPDARQRLHLPAGPLRQ